MIKKNILLAAIVLLISLAFGSVLSTHAVLVKSNLPIAELTLSQSINPKPMTLVEAWTAINDYAQKWNSGTEIVSLNSIDESGDLINAGQDGERRIWRAALVNPRQTDTIFWVLIADGQVSEEGKQSNISEIIPLSGNFKIDSPEALVLALSTKPDLATSKGKGKGFNFSLEVTPDDSLAITIRGIYQGTPAIVSIDANSGALIQSIHLTFESGGILYSNDVGQTWNASDLTGKTINSIAINPLVKNQAYAIASEEKQISLYQTLNGGENWSWVGSLPESAGNWPYDIEVVTDSSGNIQILVGTTSDLWSSKDGKYWSVIQGLPSGPKQWLASAQSQSAFRVFVSITAGESIGMYASKDLSTWYKLASNVYRFSRSFDLQSVLATNEESNQALLLTAEGVTNFKVPESSLRAAGNFKNRGMTVVESSSARVGWLDQDNVNWTLSVPVSSLATGSDFLQSRIVIAGGFRTGLYRSSDGGQSWNLILSDPSTILKGSGEIIDVAFLSETNLVAVNGGELKWRDF